MYYDLYITCNIIIYNNVTKYYFSKYILQFKFFTNTKRLSTKIGEVFGFSFLYSKYCIFDC